MTIVLTLSFLLLATISGLVLIKARVNPLLKAALIVITVWYGLALWYIPGNFMGYPRQAEILPHNSWILTYRIYEPKGIDPGSMVFWLIEIEQQKTGNLERVFEYVNKQIPRSYSIPYDRDLHKQLEKAKSDSQKGGLLMFKLGEKRAKGAKDGTAKDYPRGKFRVINPVELLPKKE